MSLICETIVSEDELESRDNNNDEELDFEEELNEEKDEKDEGELDDDEDLEEGEVKDEDEPQKKQMPQNSRQNSICRFYGRGQCTWGNNCRFVHPSGGPPPPPPPPKRVAPPVMRRPQREFVDNSESAWERGLKQAKEMIVRAHRRKEEEIDFEEKRFNLSSNDDTERHASPNEDRYDEEYERRRRLAFESAPWNNEEPAGHRIRQAETYRDPWRRSKSPNAQTRRAPESKRSHSMSSISASGSDSSDFSGSEDSFSESSSGSQKRFKEKEKKTKKEDNYDSWSESLSESESSYYSDSDEEDKRIPKRPQKEAKKPPLKKPRLAEEAPKKSPIKMTFLKKKQNLNKTAFNGEPIDEMESLSPKVKSLSSTSPVTEGGTPPPVSPRTTLRREELLQQLKAVEAAIARKRSKIN